MVKKKVDKKKIDPNANILKKAWNFMWHGDSLLSWISFLVFIFVVIKFILFPGLSLIFGTSLPIVIVESCSMYHDFNFNGWWDENKGWYEGKGISKADFESFPHEGGFNKGDIFFIRGVDKEDIDLGEVIIFTSGNSRAPIIHRVVGLDPLETKGDNNRVQFTSGNNPGRINEVDITEGQIIGKTTFARIPLLGWLKLVFFEPLRPESDRGFCS